MHRLLLATAAALVAAAVVFPAASLAGSPTRFSDRAAFERFTAAQFVGIEKRKRLIYTVTGIGCAKTALAHALCSVSARGPLGRQQFSVIVGCRDDAGHGCRYTIVPMRRNP